MSIKQIDQQTIDDGKGVGKKIAAGAERLMYDVLQATQYSTPISSTVRELTTNAWDSQREKEIALDILEGDGKVEDYFITRDGDQYNDSNFDPSYYDPNCLDRENNYIELVYTKNNGSGFCDVFEIKDHGVGLGDKRLEGVLSLGFSTKRNTTHNFGAFGLGAKVALSTGVPFYSIETVHNGRRFRCNCYPYTTKFTISKMNVEKGEMNKYIEFSDGEKVYYEETDEKNRTTISFMVKKHNRIGFEEAVKEQLIYIDNVLFTMVNNETDNSIVEYTEETKAEVLYNSDNLIVSEGTVFNKPHIVIVKSPADKTGINYGMIDFRELELEEMFGSIGFKCPIRQAYRDEDGNEIVLHDGVAVTPSREKVIWNDATKEFILGVIEKASIEAGELVEGQLSDTKSLGEWIQRCRSIFSQMDSTTALGRISNIIDTKAISPKYPHDKSIRFTNPLNMFRGMNVEIVTADYQGKPSRKELKSWSDVTSFENIYLKDGRYSPHKDIYICKTLGKGTFITIQKDDEEWEAAKAKLHKKLADKGSEEVAKALAKEQKYRETVWELMSEDVPSYAELEVPQEILDQLSKKEQEALVSGQADDLSPAERRKLEQREVGFTPRFDIDKKRSYSYVKDYECVLDKVEPKRREVLFTMDEVYYCTSEQSKLMWDIAKIAAGAMPPVGKVYGSHHVGNPEEPSFFRLSPSLHYKYSHREMPEREFSQPQIIQIRKDLAKKVPADRGPRPLDDMFSQRTEDDILTAHPILVEGYTARVIGSDWNKFSYMKHFANIDMEIKKKYDRLYDFMRKYHFGLGYVFSEKSEDNEFLQHADRLWDMQQFCAMEDDPELIKKKSQQLFVLSDVKGAEIVDVEIYNLYRELSEYNEDIGDLLNHIDPNKFSNDGAAKEIRRYLKVCNRDNWKWS